MEAPGFVLENGQWTKSGQPSHPNEPCIPPFSRDPRLYFDDDNEGGKIFVPDQTLPALVQAGDGRYIEPKSDIRRFLSFELDVSRLNRIQKYLWLAGLPKGSRPLHKQILIDRQIVITEQAGLHMVWNKSRFFVKPLPMFLLTLEYWRDYICHDEELYRRACGFLLSYAWLISYQSDLHIAHKQGLLPREIQWKEWTLLIADFLEEMKGLSKDPINQRYHYGELRLSRLNWIYRCSFLSMDFRNLRRGYFQGPDWYSQFLGNNFGWLIVLFAYITIVLSAMQVGLQTQTLTENTHFQDASYGFTVFTIAMPAIIAAMVMVSSALLVYINVSATKKYNRQVGKNRGPYVGVLREHS